MLKPRNTPENITYINFVRKRVRRRPMSVSKIMKFSTPLRWNQKNIKSNPCLLNCAQKCQLKDLMQEVKDVSNDCRHLLHMY